jgi:hypothetical protein
MTLPIKGIFPKELSLTISVPIPPDSLGVSSPGNSHRPVHLPARSLAFRNGSICRESLSYLLPTLLSADGR